jgi:L-histidine Nalpha-methyltransferase
MSVVIAPVCASVEEFAASVRAGLKKECGKELDCKYFYDEVGSALFEVISRLPEYGLTRAGERLFLRHSEEIAGFLDPPFVVAELGSGTGRNTRLLLEAVSKRQPTIYCPIDISGTALEQCSRDLSTVAGVQVLAFEREYLDGLRAVSAERFGSERLLLLFLGSTIGNLERSDAVSFLKEVRQVLLPGDALLLGTDLVKAAEQLRMAYDDPLGVTAAFNMNLLARINRELGGEFVLSQFKHEARYNEAERRVEMYLRSLVDQTVTIRRASLDASFLAGETIWTENSYKYTPDEIVHLAAQSGYRCEVQHIDEHWAFAHSLLFAA